MRCPNCNKEIREDAKFCTGCGKQIPRCPVCGSVLQRRVRFCTVDGTPIPDEINALLPEIQQTTNTMNPKDQSSNGKNLKKRKSSKFKVFLVVLLVGLVLTALAIVVLVGIEWLIPGNADSTLRLPSFVENLFGQEEQVPETVFPSVTESKLETTPEQEPDQTTNPHQETDVPQETVPILMPNCIGWHYSDVVNAFDNISCTPMFEYVYDNEVEEGHIIEQSIPENSVLADNSIVVLIVSKGADVSPDGYNQKVVVTAEAGSSYGTLVLYEWENGQWVSSFSCYATVGKNGIGSDYGEGKKKTPQGIFKLGIALSANSIPNNDWPHQLVTSDTCVVDDTDSGYYNTIQNISSLPSGVGYDPIGDTLVKGYSNVCIYIEHNGNGLNTDDVVAGKGSVITICGRSASIAPTAGCIDISSSNMTTLLSMLVYNKNPHIEISVL